MTSLLSSQSSVSDHRKKQDSKQSATRTSSKKFEKLQQNAVASPLAVSASCQNRYSLPLSLAVSSCSLTQYELDNPLLTSCAVVVPVDICANDGNMSTFSTIPNSAAPTSRPLPSLPKKQRKYSSKTSKTSEHEFQDSQLLEQVENLFQTVENKKIAPRNSHTRKAPSKKRQTGRTKPTTGRTKTARKRKAEESTVRTRYARKCRMNSAAPEDSINMSTLAAKNMFVPKHAEVLISACINKTVDKLLKTGICLSSSAVPVHALDEYRSANSNELYTDMVHPLEQFEMTPQLLQQYSSANACLSHYGTAVADGSLVVPSRHVSSLPSTGTACDAFSEFTTSVDYNSGFYDTCFGFYDTCNSQHSSLFYGVPSANNNSLAVVSSCCSSAPNTSVLGCSFVEQQAYLNEQLCTLGESSVASANDWFSQLDSVSVTTNLPFADASVTSVFSESSGYLSRDPAVDANRYSLLDLLNMSDNDIDSLLSGFIDTDNRPPYNTNLPRSVLSASTDNCVTSATVCASHVNIPVCCSAAVPTIEVSGRVSGVPVLHITEHVMDTDLQKSLGSDYLVDEEEHFEPDYDFDDIGLTEPTTYATNSESKRTPSKVSAGGGKKITIVKPGAVQASTLPAPRRKRNWRSVASAGKTEPPPTVSTMDTTTDDNAKTSLASADVLEGDGSPSDPFWPMETKDIPEADCSASQADGFEWDLARFDDEFASEVSGPTLKVHETSDSGCAPASDTSADNPLVTPLANDRIQSPFAEKKAAVRPSVVPLLSLKRSHKDLMHMPNMHAGIERCSVSGTECNSMESSRGRKVVASSAQQAPRSELKDIQEGDSSRRIHTPALRRGRRLKPLAAVASRHSDQPVTPLLDLPTRPCTASNRMPAVNSSQFQHIIKRAAKQWQWEELSHVILDTERWDTNCMCALAFALNFGNSTADVFKDFVSYLQNSDLTAADVQYCGAFVGMCLVQYQSNDGHLETAYAVLQRVLTFKLDFTRTRCSFLKPANFVELAVDVCVRLQRYGTLQYMLNVVNCFRDCDAADRRCCLNLVLGRVAKELSLSTSQKAVLCDIGVDLLAEMLLHWQHDSRICPDLMATADVPVAFQLFLELLLLERKPQAVLRLCSLQQQHSLLLPWVPELLLKTVRFLLSLSDGSRSYANGAICLTRLAMDMNIYPPLVRWQHPRPAIVYLFDFMFPTEIYAVLCLFLHLCYEKLKSLDVSRDDAFHLKLIISTRPKLMLPQMLAANPSLEEFHCRLERMVTDCLKLSVYQLNRTASTEWTLMLHDVVRLVEGLPVDKIEIEKSSPTVQSGISSVQEPVVLPPKRKVLLETPQSLPVSATPTTTCPGPVVPMSTSPAVAVPSVTSVLAVVDVRVPPPGFAALPASLPASAGTASSCVVQPTVSAALVASQVAGFPATVATPLPATASAVSLLPTDVQAQSVMTPTSVVSQAFFSVPVASSAATAVRLPRSTSVPNGGLQRQPSVPPPPSVTVPATKPTIPAARPAAVAKTSWQAKAPLLSPPPPLTSTHTTVTRQTALKAGTPAVSTLSRQPPQQRVSAPHHRVSDNRSSSEKSSSSSRGNSRSPQMLSFVPSHKTAVHSRSFVASSPPVTQPLRNSSVVPSLSSMLKQPEFSTETVASGLAFLRDSHEQLMQTFEYKHGSTQQTPALDTHDSWQFSAPEPEAPKPAAAKKALGSRTSSVLRLIELEVTQLLEAHVNRGTVFDVPVSTYASILADTFYEQQQSRSAGGSVMVSDDTLTELSSFVDRNVELRRKRSLH